jgi:hypothetical protein
VHHIWGRDHYKTMLNALKFKQAYKKRTDMVKDAMSMVPCGDRPAMVAAITDALRAMGTNGFQEPAVGIEGAASPGAGTTIGQNAGMVVRGPAIEGARGKEPAQKATAHKRYACPGYDRRS